MSTLSRYYSLLGISEAASVDEIKKAFRTKAKHYHPDVNKDPNAGDQFRSIHEAYELLIHHKTGMGFNNVKQKYQYTRSTSEQTAAAARDRADAFAKKSYETYKKSGYYAKGKLIKEAAIFVELVFYIVTIFFIPLLLSFFIGTAACYFSLGLAIIMMPQWVQIIPGVLNLSWDKVKQGLALAHFPKFTIHWILIPFSLTVYFSIGFKTMITFYESMFVWLFFFATINVYLILNKKYSIGRSIMNSCSFGLACMNVCILFNYMISFDTKTERYEYATTYGNYSRRAKGKNSVILLYNENKQYYTAYTSVRFFWDYEDIPSGNGQIVYTIKEGSLGFNVYSERSFVPYRSGE